MDELKTNYQVPYFRIENARSIAMGLITFGFNQFTESYLVKNRNDYKFLCDNCDEKQPDSKLVMGFALNKLIDSIRIHICFENFLKAIFLSNGYIVHKLDKNIFPDLQKKQEVEPIHISEILKQSKWEVNPQINSPIESLKLQIKGIQQFTLGAKILTKPKYLSLINFNQEVIEIIAPYLDYRDNLHFYTGESFSITKNDYENLMKVIEFTNKNIVRIQHELVDLNKKGDQYKLKVIE